MGLHIAKPHIKHKKVGEFMFRISTGFVAVLAFSAVLAMPGISFAQCDCGCDAPVVASNPCDTCAQPKCCCQPRPRTRLKLTKVCKDVCRLKRVCTTDACGCPTTKLVKVAKKVSRLKLVRVPVEPRKPRCSCLRRPAKPCGCAAPAVDPCGNTGCGCN